MKIPTALRRAYLGSEEENVDESENAPDAPAIDTASSTAKTPWRGKLRKWALIGGIVAVVAPIAILAAWAAITLSYAYSTGYRAGYVQKISKKGWICPTWEGELQMVNLPGAAPERWSFSVRDNVVAAAVQSSIGHR
ncbi:MAG TPA: hypothetical protein VF483_06495, partial [Gemmatimonadaceae bacterium]